MVRAAQASPDPGFCGFRAARAGEPSCLGYRVALEGMSLPVVHTGAGGTVEQPVESAAAHWLPASGRLALRARRRWRGRCAPGRLHMCSPRNCARCLLGGSGDVEDVVRCALLERLGARRASSSCRGRGWGGTPRGPCCQLVVVVAPTPNYLRLASPESGEVCHR